MKINHYNTNLSSILLSYYPVHDLLTDFYNFLVSLELEITCFKCEHCYAKRHRKIDSWLVNHSWTELFILFAILSPIVVVDLDDPLYFLFDYFTHKPNRMTRLRDLLIYRSF